MRFLILFFVLLSSKLFCFESKIKGTCIKNVSQKIYLYTYNDLLNQKLELFLEQEINDKGEFEFLLDLQTEKQVVLITRNSRTNIVVEPNKVLLLDIFPPKENTQISFLNPPKTYCDFSADTSNINFKIQKIEACIDTFTDNHFELFLKPVLLAPLLPALENAIEKKLYLRTVQEKNYLYYSMAKLYDASQPKKRIIREKYFSTNIDFSNQDYFSFFRYHFSNALQTIATLPGGEEIEIDINRKHDWDGLVKHIKQADLSIRNDTLAQLIVLFGLRSWYNQRGNNQKNVEFLLRSTELYSKSKNMVTIAKNLLFELLQFQNGMPAPNFMFLTESKKEITKETYKGQYLYISFYSSDSPEFIQEYPLYDKLRILYGKKVSFLFVSLDEKKENFLEFFIEKKVPENFVFINRDRKLLENFGVKSIPQNVLIDAEGDWKNYLVPSPSQGLKNVLKQLK
jgi:peroxiredoxin